VVPGRSVRTCVEPHAGRPVVLRCDLESFFASVTRSRARGFFDRLGVEDEVAAALAG